jgi:hypothetical protein
MYLNQNKLIEAIKVEHPAIYNCPHDITST